MQTSRAIKKKDSRHRILQAASRRLRREGLDSASIATVMNDAGLTHGTFNAHFKNKDELTIEAFKHSLAQSQPRWVKHEDRSWQQRVRRMAAAYLNPTHRDHKQGGCPIAALASEVSSSSAKGFRQSYSDGVLSTILDIAEIGDRADNPEKYDQSVALLALWIGGLNLSRNVDDNIKSDHILKVCNQASARLIDG